MEEYQYHPVCLLFPEVSPDVFARRLADYRKHPKRAGDTAVLLAVDEDDGAWKILDGRHHYRICKELGYECRFERFEGTRDELVDIAEARGINRRHQTETQIAAVIVSLNDFRKKGRPNKSALVPIKTQAELAASSGVSERTIRSTAAAAKAEPELLPAMRDGKIDAKTAAKVAKLPAATRKKVAKADDPKAAAKKALKKESEKAAPQPEPATEPEPADPAAEFVSRINRLCVALDAAKKEAGEVAAVPVFGGHVHKESVTASIEAARKALWQSRPTEACNCVRGGTPPKPECKACFGVGVTTASRVLKGGK